MEGVIYKLARRSAPRYFLDSRPGISKCSTYFFVDLVGGEKIFMNIPEFPGFRPGKKNNNIWISGTTHGHCVSSFTRGNSSNPTRANYDSNEEHHNIYQSLHP